MEKLFNSKEAAEYLSVSVFKMKRWVKMGLLKVYTEYGGNHALRFSKLDLDDFLKNTTEEDRKKRKDYVYTKKRKRRKRRWWKKPEPKSKKRIYHIITLNRDKQLDDIFQTTTPELVYTKFNELIENNKKNIIFPVKFNNDGHDMKEASYELAIIKQRSESEDSVTMLRDEYGKYIEHSTNTENWIIYDKAPYEVEETFWVYGYHPKLQRKDFTWVFDNLINTPFNDKYHFKMVNIFKNKLLIDTCGSLDMVICKNKSDAVRLYNELEKFCANKKVKFVTFGMDISYSSSKKDYIKRIEDLTGWSRKKITRNSTRP